MKDRPKKLFCFLFGWVCILFVRCLLSFSLCLFLSFSNSRDPPVRLQLNCKFRKWSMVYTTVSSDRWATRTERPSSQVSFSLCSLCLCALFLFLSHFLCNPPRLTAMKRRTCWVSMLSSSAHGFTTSNQRGVSTQIKAIRGLLFPFLGFMSSCFLIFSACLFWAHCSEMFQRGQTAGMFVALCPESRRDTLINIPSAVRGVWRVSGWILNTETKRGQWCGFMAECEALIFHRPAWNITRHFSHCVSGYMAMQQSSQFVLDARAQQSTGSLSSFAFWLVCCCRCEVMAGKGHCGHKASRERQRRVQAIWDLFGFWHESQSVCPRQEKPQLLSEKITGEGSLRKSCRVLEWSEIKLFFLYKWIYCPVIHKPTNVSFMHLKPD